MRAMADDADTLKTLKAELSAAKTDPEKFAQRAGAVSSSAIEILRGAAAASEAAVARSALQTDARALDGELSAATERQLAAETGADAATRVAIHLWRLVNNAMIEL